MIYKKYFVAGLLAMFIPASVAIAQNIQWATKILAVSSNSGNEPFGANNALESPNAMKEEGALSGLAWQPKEATDKDPYIVVGFDSPMIVEQVVIAESRNPGRIKEVQIITLKNKTITIASNKIREDIGTPTRLFAVDNTSGNKDLVSSVKITFFNDPAIPAIDAIGLLNSTNPYLGTAKALSAAKIKGIPLGSGVNTIYNEKGPVITEDGNTLYFIRENCPQNFGDPKDDQDIWFSNYDNKLNSWSAAQHLGKPLNTNEYNYVTSVSSDGNALTLANKYNLDGSMEEGLSTSIRQDDGTWSFPEPVNLPASKNLSTQANYFMSSSKNILIISQKRNDSHNSRDLYVSFKQADNSWTEAKTLGGIVNTLKDDYAPFLAADNRTLYYSTSGLPGQGGADIFITRRLDDNWDQWSAPENLGPGINTKNDDAGFCTTGSGTIAFYASINPVNKSQDIYSIALPAEVRPAPIVHVKGRVVNKITHQPIDATVVYENLETSKVEGFTQSGALTGTYQIALPGGATYGYRAVKEGFLSENANLDLTSLDTFKEVKQNLNLVPIEVGAKLTLNNIFFDFNLALLKPQSHAELNRLADYMLKHPSFTIKVNGHTDAVGSQASNQPLSAKRASAVQAYLISKKVDASRIASEGFGKLKPVASNDTEKGRQANRRVEIEIVNK